MTRFALTLEYDGGPFMGLQRQEHGPSVQQAVEEAAHAVIGETVTMHSAGRTDSGVHALAMRSHVEIAKDMYDFGCVIADTSTLATLHAREYRAGIAEIVKYGLIYDPAFFAWLESNAEPLLNRVDSAVIHAVRRSCEIKAEVVGVDEREQGLRRVGTEGDRADQRVGGGGQHHPLRGGHRAADQGFVFGGLERGRGGVGHLAFENAGSAGAAASCRGWWTTPLPAPPLPMAGLPPAGVITISTKNAPLLPSSEWRMHADVLVARPETGAVVHTHATFCTALACLREHGRIAACGAISRPGSMKASRSTAESESTITTSM